MSHVMISYARKDIEFMRRLKEALEANDIEVWVDIEDLPALTEDWWKDVCGGIEGADTVVFLSSPNSVASFHCNLEIAHAIKLKKRLAPIVIQDADQKIAASALGKEEIDKNKKDRLTGRDILVISDENWAVIFRHNLLFCKPEDDFEKVVDKLVDALKTDLGHVREHTRLLYRAIDWDESKRKGGLLLSGLETKNAETWLKTATSKEPEPASLHLDYIKASRTRQNLQQRSLFTAAGISALILLAIIGYMLWLANLKERAKGEMATFSLLNQQSNSSGEGNNLPPFSLEKYEVSYGRYRLCVQAGVCDMPDEPDSAQSFQRYRDAPEDFPVVWVSAYDAVEFCNWIGRRLPRLVEWQYAAAEGNQRPWPWGIEPPDPFRANMRIEGYFDRDKNQSVAINSIEYENGDTPLGIRHMLGNVWEWTSSYEEYQCDGTGDCPQDWDGQVTPASRLYVAGSSWQNDLSAGETFAEESFTPAEANFLTSDFGFRCASS